MRNFIALILLVISLTSFTFAQNIGQQSSDTTKLINYTDIQGNRQGNWLRKFESGKTAYTGYFVNNKLIGDFKRYYETGKLKAYIKYNKIGSVGYAVLYWNSETKMAEGKYINQNIKDSVWNYYYENGKLASTESYKEGAKDGAFKNYFVNGIQSQVLTYKNNKKDGLWKTFFENGSVRYETKHIKDKRDGPFNAYFEDGKLYLKAHYKNDMPDGKWTFYNKDGSLWKELEYINGKLVDEDKYNEEFKKQMLEWDKMKGKFSEPKEEDFFKSNNKNNDE